MTIKRDDRRCGEALRFYYIGKFLGAKHETYSSAAIVYCLSGASYDVGQGSSKRTTMVADPDGAVCSAPPVHKRGVQTKSNGRCCQLPSVRIFSSVLFSGRKKSSLLQDSLACFWLGGYFYPRLLIGRIFFIRGFWLGGYLSGCQCQPRHITARFAPNRPGIFALIPSPQDTSISLGEFKSSRSFQ